MLQRCQKIFVSVFFTLLPHQAWAIPSPDLVLSLFASLAQVVGIALAGTSAFAMRWGWYRSSNKTQSRKTRGVTAVLAALLLILSIYQYADRSTQDAQRLEAALWRKPADWDRVFKAEGISPAQLEAAITKAQVQVIDVREPEEYEVAHLHGALNLRYADLLLGNAHPLAPDKTLVFVCDSGKRSGEVCEQFQKNGIPCHVLTGGYPAWVAQSRPIWLEKSGWRQRFQTLPRFPSDTQYLDTPEVDRLITNEKAVFVDVRPESQYQSGHLPFAINIPMRGMNSEALQSRMNELSRLDSKTSFIAPCYDNRSCFHAKVLGLRLYRMGLNFKGRYTVAHEYPIPTQTKEPSAWMLVKRFWNRGLEILGKPFSLVLLWLADHLSSLVAAMLLLLVSIRLPFILLAKKKPQNQNDRLQKTEHSQWLKSHYGDDEYRLHRAKAHWHRTQHLTPWRDLMIALLQLLIFTLSWIAVRNSTLTATESLFWIPSIANPDPWCLLSGIVTALCYGLGRSRLPIDTSVWRYALHGLLVLAAVLIGWACAFMASGTVVYLIASLGLLAIGHYQVHIATTNNSPIGLWQPLSNATSLEQHGGKAVQLAKLVSNGFNVPKAYVLSSDDLTRLFDSVKSDLTTTELLRLSPLHARTLYAVRSSASLEDGQQQSYAGIFHTELQVQSEHILSAIEQVWRSYGRSGQTYRGGIIVQEMLAPQYAGVLFTRDPAISGVATVEFVQGLGQTLADGSQQPQSLLFGRLSHQCYGQDAHKQSPAQREMIHTVAPLLLAAGNQLEQRLGVPQDIEWAWAAGELYLLQSRNLTATVLSKNASPASNTVNRERERLITELQKNWQKGWKFKPSDSTALLAQTEISAELPHPTPLSLSLIQSLRAEHGSTDLAMQHWGLTYDVTHDTPNITQTAFGTTYSIVPLLRTLTKPVPAIAAIRFEKEATQIERHFIDVFLPPFKQEMALRRALDFSKLPTEVLLHTFNLWFQQFVTQHYVQADIINVAAAFHFESAMKLGNHIAFDAPIPSLSTHGHRAIFDWELAEPRFEQAPNAFEHWLSQVKTAPLQTDTTRDDAPKPSLNALQRHKLNVAQRFARLKDHAKHECLRALLPMRKLLMEIDHRFELNEHVFYLTASEITLLRSTSADSLKALAQSRKQSLDIFKVLNPPITLTAQALECYCNPALQNKPSITVRGSTHLQGQWVAGSQSVTGTVRWIGQRSHIEHLKSTDIAVTRLASPDLLGVLSKAGGLVTAVGGQLSHLAILARERNLPCIFGVSSGLEDLQEGTQITLLETGCVIQS
jgi:rifampicin phosphotransferase